MCYTINLALPCLYKLYETSSEHQLIKMLIRITRMFPLTEISDRYLEYQETLGSSLDFQIKLWKFVKMLNSTIRSHSRVLSALYERICLLSLLSDIRTNVLPFSPKNNSDLSSRPILTWILLTATLFIWETNQLTARNRLTDPFSCWLCHLHPVLSQTCPSLRTLCDVSVLLLALCHSHLVLTWPAGFWAPKNQQTPALSCGPVVWSLCPHKRRAYTISHINWYL